MSFVVITDSEDEGELEIQTKDLLSRFTQSIPAPEQTLENSIKSSLDESVKTQEQPHSSKLKRPRQAILTTSNRGVYTNKSQPHADNQRIHPTKADYPSFKKRKYSTEEKPKDEGSHSKDLSTLRDDSRYHSTHNRSKTIKNEKSRSLSKSKNATKHSNRPQPHTDSKKFYSFDDIDDYDDHDDHDDHDHYDDHNDYDDYDELFITDKKSGSTSREGVKKAQTQPHAGSQLPYLPKARFFDIPTRPAPKLVVAVPPVVAPSNEPLRDQFIRNLSSLEGPSVSLVNDIDDSSPPITFNFINVSIIGEGVDKLHEDFMVGCECRPENGRNCGCEYRTCLCIQDSYRDHRGNLHFPYAAGGQARGCLRPMYLESRNHIYECNAKCNCRSNCKNKVVQHGRQVPLEIFKTTNRGWGLRCLEPLRKGQFIDTYRGEIITNDEANLRGQQRNNNQNNYLMDLDKFTRQKFITKDELKELVSADKFEDILLRAERDDYETKKSRNGKVEYLSPDYKPPYVCDGQESGGPTKFMNHSCEPNCRLFTASYNHSDTDVYDLAFFTLKAIPRGTELTFDYLDEEDRGVITDERADEMEKEQGYRPMRCLCGSPSCRRYFFN